MSNKDDSHGQMITLIVHRLQIAQKREIFSIRIASSETIGVLREKLNLDENERLSINGRKFHNDRCNRKLEDAGFAHLSVLECRTRTGGGLLGGMHNDTDDSYKRAAMNQAPP